MNDLLRRALRSRVARAWFRSFVRATPGADVVRLGTAYGGWWVPRSVLRDGAVCWCAGVGTDVSFDLALVSAGCRVWAMDPTPRSVAWVATQTFPEGFTFLPVALWREDTTLTMYAPRDPSHVSYSAGDIQGTGEAVEVPARSVASLARELGHETIDLLKMDIEGAEGPVLDAMLRDGVRPRVLAVELDQPELPWRTVERVKSLRRNGYEVVALDGWNLTLVRDG